MADLNYFVCTLGQAALLEGEQKRTYRNINHFLDRQAVEASNLPAVGLHDISDATSDTSRDEVAKNWSCQVLTFSDVYKISLRVAAILSSQTFLPKTKQTVALLCPSTPEFLFVWLALMRLGHAVLLIAPQCSASAVAHLCTTCEVKCLFYDAEYERLAKDAVIEGQKSTLREICLQSFLPTSRSVFGLADHAPDQPASDTTEFPDVDESDVAYLHHTSGTSSGTPKPIPQTHRAGLGVLPNLDGRDNATFTTTPLYHGGIADLFRAWASNALIWLFPGKGVPITPKNIVHCIELGQQRHEINSLPAIQYFSAVPYVLQMMAADKSGLAVLQSMNIVGVGGAALPAEIGDQLVSDNVNLISRFGSAECGFLMSSHREYAKDKDWQYLRLDKQVKTVAFEPRDDGLSELVVRSGWPHMAKKNRDDGSFATADLLEPHPDIGNAWKYHSRADSQLTLITGKKFDPAPLEAAIATSPMLRDVLIFGDNQPYPGALLFRSHETREMSDKQLLSALEPAIEKCNKDSQKHVRLARNMLILMSADEPDLEKSSKGTVQRKKAEERYKDVIERAYNKADTSSDKVVDDRDVPGAIKKIITSVMGNQEDLKDDTDLFSFGIDSVACVHIRRALMGLLPQNEKGLPLTIVEDCGTVAKLTDMIVSKRHGKSIAKQDQNDLMLEMAKKYSVFTADPAVTNGTDDRNHDINGHTEKLGQTILITGATGALGVHILDLYLKRPSSDHIYLLVRGASPEAATERVSKALSHHRLTPLPSPSETKVTILQSNLSAPDLGLQTSIYHKIAHSVTIIHHIAWAVNFRLNVSSFTNNIASVQNLINFALYSSRHNNSSKPPYFLFCSSLASVANFHPSNPSSSPDTHNSKDNTSISVPEQISHDPIHSSPLGYSRSKWIAESLCSTAHTTTQLHNRIAIMRVGQLSGNSSTGIWNATEAYPLMLAQLKAGLTGCLPDGDGGEEPLHWLPIDCAAQAFREVADGMVSSTSDSTSPPTPSSSASPGGQDVKLGREGDNGEDDSIRVYHILNTNDQPRWRDLLHFVRSVKPDLQTVTGSEFVARLEHVQSHGTEAQQRHPAMKLLPHWRDAYCGNDKNEEDGMREGSEDRVKESEKEVTFSTVKTCEVAPCLGDVPEMGDEYLGGIWREIQED